VSKEIFLPKDVAVCAAIQQKHASTYALATRFFPREQRVATQVFYAFVRTADDLVDEPTDPRPESVRQTFEAWVAAWYRAYEGEKTTDPVLRASSTLFRSEKLPRADVDAFLAAMRRDIDVTRYETYEDLMQKYVYGSAAVIGQIMTRLCGVQDEQTLAAARALGEAMQLTNFLRDVRADLVQRGRLYLAQADLRDCGVSEEDLRIGHCTPGIRTLLQRYILRARHLYALADEGIPRLPRHAQRAVRLSRILYAGILDRIEAQEYDIFSRRASVSTPRKLWTAARILLTS